MTIIILAKKSLSGITRYNLNPNDAGEQTNGNSNNGMAVQHDNLPYAIQSQLHQGDLATNSESHPLVEMPNATRNQPRRRRLYNLPENVPPYDIEMKRESGRRNPAVSRSVPRSRAVDRPGVSNRPTRCQKPNQLNRRYDSAGKHSRSWADNVWRSDFVTMESDMESTEREHRDTGDYNENSRAHSMTLNEKVSQMHIVNTR